MFLLALSTVAGISVALVGQNRWGHAAFWYASFLLPLVYIGLAWVGIRQRDEDDSGRSVAND